jgi:hypothetical protein
MSLCVPVNWAANLSVVMSFPPLQRAVGVGAVYLLFALLVAAIAAYLTLFVPETKNRPSELVFNDVVHRRLQVCQRDTGALKEGLLSVS